MSAPASLRAAARVVARSSTRARVPALRRGLASSAGEHAPKKSSDMPWIIASAAVFGSSFVYLVGSGAKKTGEHAHHRQGHGLDAKGEHAPQQQSEPGPESDENEGKESEGGMKDSEGTVASAEEIKDSIQRGEKTDAPKEAHEAEKKGQSGSSGSGGGLPTEDADGNKVDPKEIEESAQRGLNEDSPKDAKKAEEAKSKK